MTMVLQSPHTLLLLKISIIFVLEVRQSIVGDFLLSTAVRVIIIYRVMCARYGVKGFTYMKLILIVAL